MSCASQVSRALAYIQRKWWIYVESLWMCCCAAAAHSLPPPRRDALAARSKPEHLAHAEPISHNFINLIMHLFDKTFLKCCECERDASFAESYYYTYILVYIIELIYSATTMRAHRRHKAARNANVTVLYICVTSSLHIQIHCIFYFIRDHTHTDTARKPFSALHIYIYAMAASALTSIFLFYLHRLNLHKAHPYRSMCVCVYTLHTFSKKYNIVKQIKNYYKEKSRHTKKKLENSKIF